MKKITKEEFEQANTKFGKREKIRPINVALDSLNVDEALIINKDEWSIKTPPIAYIPQLYRQTRSNKRFIGRTLNGDVGWVFLRIK